MAKTKTVEIDAKYDSSIVKTLYNLGASSNIISILILLFHAGHSIYTHSTINSTSNYLSKQVEGYLKKHCNHKYIEDIYDIGEDGFKKICYCNKCFDGY